MRTNDIWILLLILLLLLLGIFCIYSHASEIENELQQTTTDRLQTSGLSSSGLQVTFDGRDALLQGRVGSDEIRRAIEEETASIWGVRTIDNRLEVAAEADASGIESTGEIVPGEVAVGAAPFLELERDAENVFVRGVLATDEQKEGVLSTASDLFGAERIRDELEVDPARQAAWQDRASQLLFPLHPHWRQGRYRVDKDGILLRGTTITESGSVELLEKLNAVRASLGLPLNPKIDVVEPPPVVEVQQRINDYLSLRRVEFESGSAVITSRGREVLNEVARALYQAPNVRVQVAGHTDSQGDDAMNQGLSERRADAVVVYLGARNITPDRLEPKGFGETQPIDDNATAEGRQRNRRIEFILLEEY